MLKWVRDMHNSISLNIVPRPNTSETITHDICTRLTKIIHNRATKSRTIRSCAFHEKNVHISPVYSIVQLPKVFVINVKVLKNNRFFFANFKVTDILDTFEYGTLVFQLMSKAVTVKEMTMKFFLTILMRLLQYLIIRIIIQFY